MRLKNQARARRVLIQSEGTRQRAVSPASAFNLKRNGTSLPVWALGLNIVTGQLALFRYK